MTEPQTLDPFEARLTRLLELYTEPAVRPILASQVVVRAVQSQPRTWRRFEIRRPSTARSWALLAIALAVALVVSAAVGASLLVRLRAVLPVSILPAGAVVRDFAWSPDGSRLAVMIDVPPTSLAGPATRQLWLVNADGSSPRPLKTGIVQIDVFGSQTAWSASGRDLSYMTKPETAEIVDASGAVVGSFGGPVLWSPTRDELLLLAGNTIRKPDGGVLATMVTECCPEWSGNGDELLGTTGLSAVGSIGPDTSAVVYSRDGSLLRTVRTSNGFLSRDGSRLFYDQPSGVFYSSRLDGTDARREAEFDGFVNYAQSNAWSPDGQTLAATVAHELPNEDHRIVAISMNGSTSVLVEGVDATDPAWSPDGSLLRYQDQSSGSWSVVGRGGGASVQLDHVLAGAPSWRPSTASGRSRDTLAFIEDGSLVAVDFNGSPTPSAPRVLLAGNPRFDPSAQNGTIVIDDDGPSQAILHGHAGQPFQATFENRTDTPWTIAFITALRQAACPSVPSGSNIREGVACSIGPHETMTMTLTTWGGVGTVTGAVYWPSAVDAGHSVSGPYFDLLLELEAP